MNIEELTIKEAREIAALVQGAGPVSGTMHPYKIGACVFIRTVTHHYTGRLIAVYPQELVLVEAAWIPDDGRFSEALAKCEYNEVEPFPDGEVVIGRAAILECSVVGKVNRSRK